MAQATPEQIDEGGPDDADADWQRRVVNRSLRTATKRSIDRGSTLIRAAATLLERSNGDGFTVQDVADEAGQSLRTLYQYFESKDDLLLAVFEEAMRSYALLVRKAIADLTDPMERLAGAAIAAVRMPEFGGSGVDRGLARLRLKLSEVEPSLVGRSQAPVSAVLQELVEAAAAAGRIEVTDPEAATFLLLSLNAAFITSNTLGNDSGVRPPDVYGLTSFCLRGLGADLAPDWFDSINGRLRLPTRRIKLDARASTGASRRRRG